jgi:hypothetical protein
MFWPEKRRAERKLLWLACVANSLSICCKGNATPILYTEISASVPVSSSRYFHLLSTREASLRKFKFRCVYSSRQLLLLVVTCHTTWLPSQYNDQSIHRSYSHGGETAQVDFTCFFTTAPPGGLHVDNGPSTFIPFRFLFTLQSGALVQFIFRIKPSRFAR